MRDVERLLRDAFDDVDRSTQPSDSLLARSKSRAEQRRHRRLAATATVALVAAALGMVGLMARQNEQDGLTIVTADSSTETTHPAAGPESFGPPLSEEAQVQLAASCEAWIPKVQTAEVIFETSDGLQGVIAVLREVGADAERVLDELGEQDIGSALRLAVSSELRAAQSDLANASQSVEAERLGNAAVNVRVARSRYNGVAEMFAGWGVEECVVGD